MHKCHYITDISISRNIKRIVQLPYSPVSMPPTRFHGLGYLCHKGMRLIEISSMASRAHLINKHRHRQMEKAWTSFPAVTVRPAIYVRTHTADLLQVFIIGKERDTGIETKRLSCHTHTVTGSVQPSLRAEWPCVTCKLVTLLRLQIERREGAGGVCACGRRGRGRVIPVGITIWNKFIHSTEPI